VDLLKEILKNKRRMKNDVLLFIFGTVVLLQLTERKQKARHRFAGAY